MAQSIGSSLPLSRASSAAASRRRDVTAAALLAASAALQGATRGVRVIQVCVFVASKGRQQDETALAWSCLVRLGI